MTSFSVPIYYPVLPYILQDGTIDSLQYIVPDTQSKILNPAPVFDLSKLNDTIVAFAPISAQVVANLGFGALLNVGSTVNVSYFLLEISSTFEPIATNQSIVTAHIYGVGVRIVVKAWSINTKANISYKESLAASAVLNLATTVYDMSSSGFGISAMKMFLPLIIGSLGAFDATRLAAISGLMEAMNSYRTSANATLYPVLLGVELNLANNIVPFNASLSGIYALNQIAKGSSLNQALQAMPSQLPSNEALQSTLVSSVYSYIVAGTNDTKPSTNQITKAKQAIAIGK